MGNLWRRKSTRKCTFTFLLASNKPVNVMLVGDSGVGKTSLLSSSIAHKPISASDARIHIDTVIDNREFNYEHNKKKYNITIWDTGAQPHYASLRSMSYPAVELFFLVFAVNDIPSYEHVINVWVPEIRKKNSKAFFVLIGTKIETREDSIVPGASRKSILIDKRLTIHSDYVHHRRIGKSTCSKNRCS
jgi:small GTP-binding protein